VSTSYQQQPHEWQQARHMAKAPAKKPAAGKAAPPAKADTPKVRSPFQKLRVRHKQQSTLSVLGPKERSLAHQLLPDPPLLKGQEVAAPPPDLTSIKQLGLPLSSRDVIRLTHDSLGVAAGQAVQLRPYVFSSIFQSAPAVADYVANALQAGAAWPRIERFFLSAVEAEPGVAAMRVQVKGRLGRKASMSSTKAWVKGAIRLQNLGDAVDYGTATALTRLGVLGVKVWVRYTKEAAAPATYRPHDRTPTYTTPLSTLLTMPRTPLPYKSSSAWWNTPGPSQPATNRTWEAVAPGYDPPAAAAVGLDVDQFLGAHDPLLFTSDAERQAFLARLPSEGAEQVVSSAEPSQ